MRLTYELSRADLSKLPIIVIVENWERFVGRHTPGRKQREAYHAEFSEKERKLLSGMYNRYFYRWILVTGFPDHFSFRKLQTINLIRRAGSLFASI